MPKTIAFLVMLGSLVVAVLLPPAARASDTVNPGWSLLQTEPGTSFLVPPIGAEPFQGVPLGTFDFGGPIGVQGTGLTDTIIRRVDPAAPADAMVPIELVALHLMSVNPLAGPGTHLFVTLQSERGGPASTGQLTINGLNTEGDPHGGFSSFFDVFYDVRQGSFAGPIVLSDQVIMNGSGTWRHLPLPGDIEISGVNTFLNNANRNTDFFPIGLYPHVASNGVQNVSTANVAAAPIPEPSTYALMLAGLVAVAVVVRRRSGRAR